jgi:HD-GYP domain-containing protein (c-di-GMP phosphodiesterase class II)
MIIVLKKMRYEQLIFPKKIRNEKTLQEIRKASLSLYKVHEKLKACGTIEKEISKNKKLENGQTQTQTKNFDIFLKVKEQSLIAKINKTVYDINSVQLPMFDDIFNKISLEKRTKKLIQKIRLTKGLEKKIRIITSNGKVDDVETLKNRKVTKEF